MKITIDKEVLDQALDALVIAYSDKLYDGHSATAASSFEADIAAIKALAQPAEQQDPAGEPYAWHYQNKSGTSLLHLQPSKRLDADMQAAKDFPQAHFITALFTRPAVPLTDAQREWIVATCPTPASIISAVEAALIGGAE